MTYNISIHRQHYKQTKCRKECFHTGSGPMMCTLYNPPTWYLHCFIMQHTIGAHVSSSLFNFFLVPLSHLLAMAFSLCQSPDNTAFIQSIKFWKIMKRLPVFTSYTSNSKRLHSFSPIFVPVLLWQCFFQACLFLLFWLTRFGKVSELSPNLMCMRAVITSDCFYWEYCCINNWFMKFPCFMTMGPATWPVNILL